MKTAAAILVEQRQPLLIDEIELPALSYGQVLVQVKATRICGSQLGEIDGVKGPDKFLPHLLGHEAGGIVLETGPEVSHVAPGDHVVLHWRPGLGINARPAQYRLGSRVINAGNITTFQGLTIVSENRLTKIPADIPFETAALLADTLTTGFGAVSRETKLHLGSSVAVIGVGGIGLGVVLAAHLAGTHPVIAVDIHEHKLAKAREFGATHTINSTQTPDLAATLREIAGPLDAVYDVTGNAAVIAQAWSAASSKGHVLLVGVMRHDQQLSLNTLPLHYGKTLTGTEGGASRPHEDIPRILRLLAGRGIDPRGMITHRCTLDQINPAIAAMRRGESIHTIITF